MVNFKGLYSLLHRENGGEKAFAERTNGFLKEKHKIKFVIMLAHTGVNDLSVIFMSMKLLWRGH